MSKPAQNFTDEQAEAFMKEAEAALAARIGKPAAKPTGDLKTVASRVGSRRVEAPLEEHIGPRVNRKPKKTLAELTRNLRDIQGMEFKPLKFVVPRYVPEGLTLIIGKPKVGKSWLALQLALAVATGGDCLGERCTQGDALYLALEDNDRRIQARAKVVLGKDRWPALTIATEWPRLNEGGFELIEEWIKANANARVILIDVLLQIRKLTSGKEAIYQADYEALIKLHDLAGKHRVAIVVLHHRRKGDAEDIMDTASGSLGLTAATDCNIVLHKEDGGLFLTGVGRDIEEFDLAVTRDQQQRLSVVGDAWEVKLSDERREVLEALRQNDNAPMSPSEIATAVCKPLQATRNRLYKMVKDGDLIRADKGKYTVADEFASGGM